MKKVYSIATGIIVFLGVGHTVLTPMFYPAFSADALWFAGTGLALLFLGLLNWVAIRANLLWIYRFVIPANVIGGAFLTAVVAALPEIQAFLAVIAVWLMALASIFARAQTTSNLVNSMER